MVANRAQSADGLEFVSLFLAVCSDERPPALSLSKGWDRQLKRRRTVPR